MKLRPPSKPVTAPGILIPSTTRPAAGPGRCPPADSAAMERMGSCGRSVRGSHVAEPRPTSSRSPPRIRRHTSASPFETLTATVTALTGVPTPGSVTFLDGSTLLGTVALNNNGQATFTQSNFALGSHAITAEYSGSALLAASQVGVEPTSPSTPVGSGFFEPDGVAVDAAGDVFIADTGNNRVVEVNSSGVQTTIASGLSSPNGVAVDAAGDVFIADSGNNRVLEVTPSGAQTTIGTGLSSPEGVAVDGLATCSSPTPAIRGVLEVNRDHVQTSVGRSSRSHSAWRWTPRGMCSCGRGKGRPGGRGGGGHAGTGRRPSGSARPSRWMPRETCSSPTLAPTP